MKHAQDYGMKTSATFTATIDDFSSEIALDPKTPAGYGAEASHTCYITITIWELLTSSKRSALTPAIMAKTSNRAPINLSIPPRSHMAKCKFVRCSPIGPVWPNMSRKTTRFGIGL